MARHRSGLHNQLKALCPSVYFQPPENVRMSYPAIVYALDDIRLRYADDGVYKHLRRYSVTYITLDPDNDVVDKIASLQYSSFDRFYIANNLNHYAFSVYF